MLATLFVHAIHTSAHLKVLLYVVYREYQLINISVYKIHIYAQIIHHMQWLPHAGMAKKHGISDFKAEFKIFGTTTFC